MSCKTVKTDRISVGRVKEAGGLLSVVPFCCFDCLQKNNLSIRAEGNNERRYRSPQQTAEEVSDVPGTNSSDRSLYKQSHLPDRKLLKSVQCIWIVTQTQTGVSGSAHIIKHLQRRNQSLLNATRAEKRKRFRVSYESHLWLAEEQSVRGGLETPAKATEPRRQGRTHHERDENAGGGVYSLCNVLCTLSHERGSTEG